MIPKEIIEEAEKNIVTIEEFVKLLSVLKITRKELAQHLGYSSTQNLNHNIISKGFIVAEMVSSVLKLYNKKTKKEIDARRKFVLEKAVMFGMDVECEQDTSLINFGINVECHEKSPQKN